MTRAAVTRYAFNRGIISRRALHRLDLKRSALAAETQTNWMPLVLGPMMLRPGTRYSGRTQSDAAVQMIPFVFSTTDTALLECSASAMRVWISDALLTRPTVSSTVTNGTFDAGITGWTDSDESGGVSTGVAGGYLNLAGTETAYAQVDQEIPVAVADRGVEHGLRVQVIKGTVTLSVGATIGTGTYISDMLLGPGWHSVAVTPTANFWIRLASRGIAPAQVSACTIEAWGVVTLPAPWAAGDLGLLRYDQSGDVVFIAYGTGRQQRIERQATRSWSVVDYLPKDGPFRSLNTGPITLTPSVLTGIGTLTASKPLFSPSHVGALYRLESVGQTVARDITAENQWSDPIRVTGISGERAIAITVSALTGTHTVVVQRSIGAIGLWTDVSTLSWTANVSTSYNDTLDNQIIYYRIGCKTGGYTSGGSTTSLSSASGSISGVCRVTAWTSATVVAIDVLKAFGAITATNDWYEGMWSGKRGWPSAVALYEGRLWWAGKDSLVGSLSDAYSSFDDAVEGDSGLIKRTIGSGPVDSISWLLPLGQLLIGTQGGEKTAKASSLDEPLTPTACALKPISTQGSAAVSPIVVDTSGIFVQRNSSRIYELALNDTGYTYSAKELTAIVPELGATGFTRLAVQRAPDTRVHCVRGDGKVAVLVYDRVEEVNSWVTIETDGEVEDVVVLPAATEDAVYYVVKRTLGAATVRYLERMALLSESVGAATTVLTDASICAAGPLSTVTGLDHLEGKTVAAWGNSKDLGTYTVVGGAVTLSENATGITVGLPYTATFKSARLALSDAPLTQRSRIDHVGLVMLDTHPQGLQYGQELAYLDNLPLMEQGVLVDPDTIRDLYGEDAIPINGTWTTDSRLCLVAASPRPCTVAAAVVVGAENAK